MVVSSDFNQALVLDYGKYMCLFIPLEEVLVVFFPEGTRRRGTGTGGVVV